MLEDYENKYFGEWFNGDSAEFYAGYRAGVSDTTEELGTYTHRNGESDPPTVEGYYWVVDTRGDEPVLRMAQCNGHYTFRMWLGKDTDPANALVPRTGILYHGPIPMPKGAPNE